MQQHLNFMFCKKSTHFKSPPIFISPWSEYIASPAQKLPSNGTFYQPCTCNFIALYANPSTMKDPCAT